MAADPGFLETVAYFGSALLALVLLAVTFAGFWKAATDSSPLLLGELLRRQGTDLRYATLATADGRGFGLAVKRCTECKSQARCREWLASGASEGYEAFCPNSGFVARAKWLGT